MLFILNYLRNTDTQLLILVFGRFTKKNKRKPNTNNYLEGKNLPVLWLHALQV